jgi:hypothetical protein
MHATPQWTPEEEAYFDRQDAVNRIFNAMRDLDTDNGMALATAIASAERPGVDEARGNMWDAADACAPE